MGTEPHKALAVWFKRASELVTKYKLDLMWFDFGFCTPDYEEYRLDFLANYYNQGIEWNKGVVLNYKKIEYTPIPDGAAILDLERGKMDRIRNQPWQTDTSIGRNSWSYVKDWQNKPAGELIDELVDIVSKNGNLLLNVGPKTDGTIPNDQRNTLLEIGQWLKVHGEGIYASRPWIVYGEGPSTSKIGDHTEYNQKQLSEKDLRFTKKDNAIYVFVMDAPTENIVIQSMSTEIHSLPDEIIDIELVGSKEKIQWKRNSSGLVIEKPEKVTNPHVTVFKINLSEAPDGVYKAKKKGARQ